MNQETIKIGDRQVAAGQISDVVFHISDLGGCCVDIGMTEERGLSRHEVVQFGADSDGATDFARALMNITWPTGWLFSDLMRYEDGISFCHVEAGGLGADIVKQKAWLFVFMPNLNVHSMLDERNQEYGMCAGTPWEGAM